MIMRLDYLFIQSMWGNRSEGPMASFLELLFGDYMALPPEDKRYPEHFISMELAGKEGT